MNAEQVARAIINRWRWAKNNAKRGLALLQPPRRTAHAPFWKRPAPSRDRFARFGKRSLVAPPATIDGAEGIELGDDVSVLDHATIAVAPGGRLRVGNGGRIGRFVSISCAQRIDIGPRVVVADRASIVDTLGPARVSGWPGLPSPLVEPVMIGADVRIGVGAIVGPGARVHDGAVIGDGAVVNGEVARGSTVFGNPAMPVAGP